MKWKKYGCLQPNIDRKDSGQAVWVTGLFWVLLLAIVLHCQLQMAAWHSASVYMEDALAASNLASALIDIEEYGKSHKVIIRDIPMAYAVYREALRTNLQLDGNGYCAGSALFEGPVQVVDYIIYNVDGNVVETVQLDSLGQVVLREKGIKGTVLSPDGNVIEQTGVYSELKFAVTGFPGVEIEACKGKLVDIVPQKGVE